MGVGYSMHDKCTAWEALKRVQSNRGLGINAKKCPYEGLIVPTALHGHQKC